MELLWLLGHDRMCKKEAVRECCLESNMLNVTSYILSGCQKARKVRVLVYIHDSKF